MNTDLVFALIGPLLLAGGIYVLIKNIRHRKTWLKTTGKVIGLNTQLDSDGNTVWAPIIKYSDQNRVSNVVHSTVFVTPCPYSVDDDIELFYNPTDPSKFLIDNFMFEYFAPLMAIIMGAVFLILGVRPMLKQ